MTLAERTLLLALARIVIQTSTLILRLPMVAAFTRKDDLKKVQTDLEIAVKSYEEIPTT